jgi:hypothetical protein
MTNVYNEYPQQHPQYDVSRPDLDKVKQPITAFPFADADADNLSRACLAKSTLASGALLPLCRACHDGIAIDWSSIHLILRLILP